MATITKTLYTKDIIYTDPVGVFEAFTDILEAMHTGLFTEITFDADRGILEYYLPMIDKHVTKIFDTEQAPPELAADVMQWLFSMLDGAANL